MFITPMSGIHTLVAAVYSCHYAIQKIHYVFMYSCKPITVYVVSNVSSMREFSSLVLLS